MSLPIILPPGYISIYGAGNLNGISGVVPDNTNLLFGIVDQVLLGGIPSVLVGQSVMFYNPDVLYRLIYGGQPYTIIDKIEAIETGGMM